MSLYLFLALLRTVSTVKTLSKSRGGFVSKLQCQNKKETIELVLIHMSAYCISRQLQPEHECIFSVMMSTSRSLFQVPNFAGTSFD